MHFGTVRVRPSNLLLQGIVALACAALLMPRGGVVLAQGTTAPPAGATEPAAAKLPPEQLESLVAPIALYPDPLLAQTLVAATYPLEIIQLQQWLTKNPGLKDKALVDAVAKQPWDPAIQSMAAVPDVVKRLADDIQWTTDLGNAFLAQQGDVMDAVQRMRKKAMDKGALAPNEQQKVETQEVEGKTIIVVESANPEVVYVPTYSPTVVYGAAPYYPYPPIYYPPYVPGAAFVSFSFGVMIGAAWGGYCCGMGWGNNDIDIDIDNNFNRNNINSGNRTQGGNRNQSGKWQHDAQHRGAAPYADRATASKYGGTARGEAPGSRQASARQQPGGAGNRAASPGVSDRSAGGSRAGSGGASTMDRGGGAVGAGSMERSGGRAAASTMDRGGSGGGSANRVGSYEAPRSSSPRPSGVSGGYGGYNGNSARAASSRGASSMGGRSGGRRR